MLCRKCNRTQAEIHKSYDGLCFKCFVSITNKFKED